jgi:hypothetical protein
VCADSSSNEPIDSLISVTIYIPLSEDDFNSSHTTGCIDISAPDVATPSRHPQVPNTDFTFRKRVLDSHNQPERPRRPGEAGDGPELSLSCAELYSEEGEVVVARNMTLGAGCSDVSPPREQYRKHGIINIYLTQDQKKQAYARILLGTLGVAVVGVAFAVGIGCTERPPKPKNRPE